MKKVRKIWTAGSLNAAMRSQRAAAGTAAFAPGSDLLQSRGGYAARRRRAVPVITSIR